MPEKSIIYSWLVYIATAFIGGFALWQSKRVDTLQKETVSETQYSKDQKLMRATILDFKKDFKDDNERLEKIVLDGFNRVHDRIDTGLK